MADRDRYRLPTYWKRLSVLSETNSQEEVTERICDTLLKKNQKPLNELTKILTTSQQRIISTYDFDMISDPDISEKAKCALREYDPISSKLDLPSHVLSFVLHQDLQETLIYPLMNDAYKKNSSLIQRIFDLETTVSKELLYVSETLLLNGKIMKKPKIKDSEMLSYGLN